MAKTILVRNQNGQLGEIPVEQVSAAIQEGYQIASPEEAKESALQQEYGEGIGTEARAFGEGVLRGVSVGLSDVALRGLGADAEGLRERRERSPIASATGEVAGIAAPLVVSSLAGPAGPAAVIASRTPVVALSRASMALGETAAGAMQGSRVAKVLGKALSPAIGSTIEGAAYGLGASVSEEMLGESGLTAERLIGNVGLGGLFGGALGGIFGAFTKPTVAKAIDGALLESGEKAAANPANLKEAADEAGIIDLLVDPASMGRKRAGAKAIEQAAADLGAPIAPGMIGDKNAGRLTDLLINSQTLPGKNHAKIYDTGFDIAKTAVDDAIGASTGKSMAEVGEELQERLIQSFEAKAAPFEANYAKLRESTQNIPISEKSKDRIAKNLLSLKVNNYDQAQKAMLDDVANDLIYNTTSVDGLRSIKTGVQKAAAVNPNLWGVSGDIAERLDGFIDRSIIKAVNELPPQLRSEGKNLLTERKELGKAYSAFRKEMDSVGGALFGQKRINGPQHFLSLLEKERPEKFAERLFTKKNARHLKFMQENFPEEMALLSRYQKDAIIKSAGLIKGDKARMNHIFKKIDSMEKEARNAIFNPEELKKISSAKTYLDAFPEAFNTSRTAHAADALSMWTSPVTAVTATTRDLTMLAALKGFGPVAESQVQALSKIEKLSRSTAERVASTTKSIITGSKSLSKSVPAGAIGAAAASSMTEREKEQETIKMINELSSDPEMLINRLDEATKDVSQFAPVVTGNIGLTATNAVQFLSTKVPPKPPMGPLGGEYEYSDYDLSMFNRYADVVKDPVSVLEQVQSGTLTKEAVEAVSQVYPGLYSDMRLSIMNDLADAATQGEIDRISYGTKMSLSLFLQEDMMQSIMPGQILSLQAAMVKTNPGMPSQGMKRPTQAGLSSLSGSTSSLTPMQASMLRGVNDV